MVPVRPCEQTGEKSMEKIIHGEMVGVLLGSKAAKQLNVISLSDNVVKRCTDDMAEDVLKQLASTKQKAAFMLSTLTSRQTLQACKRACLCQM